MADVSTPETTSESLTTDLAQLTVSQLTAELTTYGRTSNLPHLTAERVALAAARVTVPMVGSPPIIVLLGRIIFAPTVNLVETSRGQRAAFIARAFFREFSRAAKASATRARRRGGLAAYRLRVRERRRAPPRAVVSAMSGNIDAQTGTPCPVPRLVAQTPDPLMPAAIVLSAPKRMSAATLRFVPGAARRPLCAWAKAFAPVTRHPTRWTRPSHRPLSDVGRSSTAVACIAPVSALPLSVSPAGARSAAPRSGQSEVPHSPALVGRTLRASAAAFVPQDVGSARQHQGHLEYASPSSVDSGAFTGFARIPVVNAALAILLASGNFNPAAMRRAQARVGVDGSAAPDLRPVSTSIREMYDVEYMLHGVHPLPLGASGLRVAAFDIGHRRHCSRCQLAAEGTIDPACYFFDMRLQISNGISWPMDDDELPVALYEGGGPDGNHASYGAHKTFADKKIAKMTAAGWTAPWGGRREDLVCNPHGVAIQRAPAVQMEHLTGIKVRDDASYDRAAAAFARSHPHLAPPKRRLISDATGSGLNGKTTLRRFRFDGLAGALELLFQGCWMYVSDHDTYYHRFPVATERQRYLGFVHDGTPMTYRSLPFGLAPAPYISSCWTAEALAELRSLGHSITAMIDDYLGVAASEEKCDADGDAVEANLEEKGYVMSVDKRQRGQTVNFLGFRLSSFPALTVSVIPAKAAGFLLLLESYVATLRENGDVPHALWQHVCGKLEDYAQVSQEGKIHNAWAWSYLKHGGALSEHGRANLLADLTWWIAQLDSWARGAETGVEYPVLNGRALAAQPANITVVVSDMSGEDGLGWFHGALTDTNPRYRSMQWPRGFRPAHSFAGELMAPEQYLREARAAGPALASRPDPSLLIVVMDSLGAVQSLNSGRCADTSGRALLRPIFEQCTAQQRTLLALWHPRTCNTLADFLSHFAALSDRSSVGGRLADIPGALGGAPDGGDGGAAADSASAAAVLFGGRGGCGSRAGRGDAQADGGSE